MRVAFRSTGGMLTRGRGDEGRLLCARLAVPNCRGLPDVPY